MRTKLTCIIIAAVALVCAAQRYQIEVTPEQKVSFAERIIETYYLDDVDGNKLADEAIKAMLKTLDPHSSYSDPQETQELTQPLDGNFSGIGVQFNMVNDTLYVAQTISGGPSEKVGILAGDRILMANDSVISGGKLTNSQITKKLRGPKGSTVDLLVKRRGVAEPLSFRVVRDDIPIYSVDAAYMAAPGVGYIKVSRFAEKTGSEFYDALNKLKAQGMVDLIVDLEDNGGGYLGSAVDLAGNFLKKNDLVTFTESPKLGKNEFDVERNGKFVNGKLVVLVNQYSASASEIFSGAIQDHDRGLIVGRRTFGKGLVQRPFPMPDGSMIRLTVSRYHTPSGRSIQKPYVEGDEEAYNKDILNRFESGELNSDEKIEFPDSLKYLTLKNRRTVYGGGGIMPDLFVPIDTVGFSDYYRDLVGKGEIIRTAVTYFDENRQSLKKRYPSVEKFIEEFEITPDILQMLIDFGTADGIEYKEEDFIRSKELISTILKGMIGRDIFEQQDYYRIVYPTLNPVYKAALELIADSKRYNDLLTHGRHK